MQNSPITTSAQLQSTPTIPPAVSSPTQNTPTSSSAPPQHPQTTPPATPAFRWNMEQSYPSLSSSSVPHMPFSFAANTSQAGTSNTAAASSLPSTSVLVSNTAAAPTWTFGTSLINSASSSTATLEPKPTAAATATPSFVPAVSASIPSTHKPAAGAAAPRRTLGSLRQTYVVSRWTDSSRGTPGSDPPAPTTATPLLLPPVPTPTPSTTAPATGAAPQAFTFGVPASRPVAPLFTHAFSNTAAAQSMATVSPAQATLPAAVPSEPFSAVSASSTQLPATTGSTAPPAPFSLGLPSIGTAAGASAAAASQPVRSIETQAISAAASAPDLCVLTSSNPTAAGHASKSGFQAMAHAVSPWAAFIIPSTSAPTTVTTAATSPAACLSESVLGDMSQTSASDTANPSLPRISSPQATDTTQAQTEEGEILPSSGYATSGVIIACPVQTHAQTDTSQQSPSAAKHTTSGVVVAVTSQDNASAHGQQQHQIAGSAQPGNGGTQHVVAVPDQINASVNEQQQHPTAGSAQPGNGGVLRSQTQQLGCDDFMTSLLRLLPATVRTQVQLRLIHHLSKGRQRVLTDVIADSNRPVRLRYSSSSSCGLSREEEVPVSMRTEEAVQLLQQASGPSTGSGSSREVFASSSRAGVSGTLHRIGAMKNSAGKVNGLTYRIGRHLPGVAQPLRDILARVAHGSCQEAAGSLLLLGPPGVGKTTLLRDMTYQLANTFEKLVMVVDNTGEIAGGGDDPHACIGRARRMTGSSQQSKYELLQEAVTNHGPEVVIVDEIGDKREVAAIKDIAQRGVVVVATAHGTSLKQLVENPVLNSLVGGKQWNTIGDMQARFCDGRKTRQERAEAPTFSMVLELHSPNELVLHSDVARSVDAILSHKQPRTELRSTVPTVSASTPARLVQRQRR